MKKTSAAITPAIIIGKIGIFAKTAILQGFKQADSIK
jgi:hypothetical protein